MLPCNVQLLLNNRLRCVICRFYSDYQFKAGPFPLAKFASRRKTMPQVGN
jgi:hypothetical protein